MLKKRNLFIFVFFVFSAWGGDERGNGGDVVSCISEDGIKGYEVLDIYEAKILRDIKLDLGDSLLPVEKKVMIALDRLRGFSKRRAKRYTKWLSKFYSETKFLTSIDFGDIEDSSHIFIPEDCELEQVVNQQTPRFSLDKRYFINKTIWDKLDNDNKAALILHELIYRDLLSKTSIPVRYFNSFIFSHRLEGATANEFFLLIKEVGFFSLEIQGVLVDLEKPLLLYPNAKLNFAVPVRDSYFYYQNQKLFLNSNIRFFESGQLKYLDFSNIFYYESKDFTQKLPFSGFRGVRFYESGYVKEGFIAEELEIRGPSFELTLPQGGRVSFYRNGSLKEIDYIHGKGMLGNRWVKLSEFPNVFEKVTFFEDGRLQKIILHEATDFEIGKKNYKLDRLLKFDKNGNIILGMTSRFSSSFTRVQGIQIKLKSNSKLKFYPQGLLHCLIPAEKIKLKNYRGTSKWYEENREICFNDNELAVW